jgi:hypothetical protein
MGIRVQCPNGHKLNIKRFLAGRRGKCPHCGAKFLIPNDAPTDNAGVEEEIVLVPADADPNAPADQAAAYAASSTAVEAVRTWPVAVPATDAAYGAAAPVPVQPVTSYASDLISEAPNAAWFVRHPAAGQFGPTSGDVLRQWTSEGRVTPDSLIWREGWPSWRPATAVFPHLAAAQLAQLAVHSPSPFAGAAATAGPFDLHAMETAHPSSASYGRLDTRRGYELNMVYVTVGLLVALLICTIVLLFIVF